MLIRSFAITYDDFHDHPSRPSAHSPATPRNAAPPPTQSSCTRTNGPAGIGAETEITAAVAASVENFGGLDILVNNAGIGAFARVGELTTNVPKDEPRNPDAIDDPERKYELLATLIDQYESGIGGTDYRFRALPKADVLARAKGIPVVVDGAHSFAHLDFKHADLDCDYFGTSLHKFLFAPPAIATISGVSLRTSGMCFAPGFERGSAP